MRRLGTVRRGNKTSVPIKIIATKVLGSSNITKFACEVSFEEVWLRISCDVKS